MKSPDVFQWLLDANKPEAQEPLFSLSDLSSESSLLIIAGSDTTSTSLAATLFYILHNVECLSNVQTEIRRTFSSIEDIRTGQQLSSCHYLRACIDESLRMSPPVGGLMPREVLPGGFEVEGHFFPAGTELGTPHYALHHKETYYPDPFHYKPERWLVSSGSMGTLYTDATSVSLAQGAFCAFSIGPRSYIGKVMAYQEMMVVLARILWKFEIRLQGGSTMGEGSSNGPQGRRRKGEYQLHDTFASKNDGPMVEFRVFVP